MEHRTGAMRVVGMPGALVALSAAAAFGIAGLLATVTARVPEAGRIERPADVAPLGAPANAPVRAGNAPNHGRCVGMFLDTTSGGGSAGAMLPRQVPADASNLLVVGDIPCRDQVFAWASRGTYRVFEDGAIQFLASPMPPCPNGDFYVWIEFPK
jgi:hypothetical protein